MENLSAARTTRGPNRRPRRKKLGTAVREFTTRHARARADDDSRRPRARSGRATPDAHRLRTPSSDGGAHGPLVRRHLERRRVRRAPRLHLARRGVATRIYAHARRRIRRSRGVAPAGGSDVRGRGMARVGRNDVQREQSRRTLSRASQGADARSTIRPAPRSRHPSPPRLTLGTFSFSFLAPWSHSSCVPRRPCSSQQCVVP